jgi:hypothetical protein
VPLRTKGRDKIVPQVASLLRHPNEAFQSLLMLGWGGGDDPVEKKFADSVEFRSAAQSWCSQGGRFIVQGERTRVHKWPTWFNKEWTDGSYYRTDHKCTAVGEDATHWCQWYKTARGAVTSTYNVKACMLQDVAADEVLFGTTEESSSYSLVPHMRGVPIDTGLAAVAFGRYGEKGTVSFFGDVNFEDETLQIMSVIARGESID